MEVNILHIITLKKNIRSKRSIRSPSYNPNHLSQRTNPKYTSNSEMNSKNNFID
jgi:hypothetical protein